MAHTVLARKWRPKRFAHLVGQQTAVTVLNNILQNNRLHHAYLLTGTRGVGKTTIARIIAKALNCSNLDQIEPCGNCDNCKDIDSGRFVDVIEIDAASNTGVDNIRELIDNAQYAPTIGKYKVYIIDEVHMLSKSAFNAMLKTLEEPPAHAIFVLATTDVQKVPVTILSRCLQLKLRNLLPTEIAEHLAYVLDQENITFESDALDIISHAAHGSMRDALSITDQAIAYTNHNINLSDIKNMLGITDDIFIYNILDAIIQGDSNNLIQTANEIYNQGHDLENVLLKLNQSLCNVSLMQLGGVNDSKLQKYASSLSVNDVQLYFEITNLGLEQITKSNNKYQIFIMTLLRMTAFTIGNKHDKHMVISSSNFNVNNSNVPIQEATTTPKKSEEVKETPVKIEEVVKPTSLQPQVVEFDGNWVSLVEKLESKLEKSVHPILVNAKFDSYLNNQFNITVNDKYEGVVNLDMINNINKTFSEHFGYTVKFNLNFLENVGTTLKEKRQVEQEQKQKFAEDLINNDLNLNKMKEMFSATIVPNSIKPA